MIIKIDGPLNADETSTARSLMGDSLTAISSVRSIHHPGHAARPLLLPAPDLKADEAVKAFADKISAFIEGTTGLVVPKDEDD